MASLYLLIPVALIFVGIAIALFIWAVKNRQFEDLDKEGARILFEQREIAPPSSESTITKTPAGSTDSNSQAAATDPGPIDRVSREKGGDKLKAAALIRNGERK